MTAFSSIGQILQVLGYKNRYETEYRFHNKRKWRFDYAIPEMRIALEYEGIYGKGKSRHTTVSGYAEDCAKYNEAALYGYTVLRFTKKDLENGNAVDLIQRALASAHTPPDLKQIAEAVTEACGTGYETLWTQHRYSTFVDYRRAFCLVARQYNYGREKIGAFLHRDKQSVYNLIHGSSPNPSNLQKIINTAHEQLSN